MQIKFKITQKMKILLGSILVATVLIVVGWISSDIGVLGNFTILATFIVATPQLFIAYDKYRSLKEIEEKFPIFLRDLIESIRSGMPFHKAIHTASKFEYGAFTKEIKKMSNQLSWGMTLDKVLDKFAERVKRSKRLYTATKIIRESYISGGDVVSILESVADNSNMLEESEKEKRSLLSQYVLLMYAISIIFVIIVAAINKLLIPIFQTSSRSAIGEVVGLTNPCTTCSDLACNICGIFEGTSKYVFSIDPSSIAAYYTSLFFLMALVQSIFSGLVAGQISENSLTAGIKHSLILVGITFGSFSILIRLGFLGV